MPLCPSADWRLWRWLIKSLRWCISGVDPSPQQLCMQHQVNALCAGMKQLRLNCMFLLQPAFGAASTPAFGASTPAFGATGFGASAPAFGSTGFGAASTPAFGSASPAPFGSPSATPAFGPSTPAFGAGKRKSSSLHLCKPSAILLGWNCATSKACFSAMPELSTSPGMAS